MTWPSLRSKRVWFDEVGYTPTDTQLAVHGSEARHLLIGGGERGGKSACTALEAFGCFPKWELLYIVGETYENCTPEFAYLADSFRLLGERTGSHLIIRERRPPGGQQRSSLDLRVGDDYKKIVTISTQRQGGQSVARKGEAPDMILLVEFGVLSYDVYLSARARVAEKRGRVILSGTFPDDVGWQAELWRRWKGDNDEGGESFSVPTWSNLRVFPGGWDDPEIKALRSIYPEAELMRRFGAEPQKPATLVFPEFSHSEHVREFVEFDERLPVELWMDPGYGESAYAVLALQLAGPYAFVIDEIYKHGLICQEIIEIAKKREWWEQVGKASRFQTGGVIDVAGRQHHASESQIEIWRNEADVALRSQRVAPRVGRERIKSFLMPHPETGVPRLLFSPKCKNTFIEFNKYKWKKRVEERLSGEEPLNKNNDAIKALGYGLVDRFGVIEPPSIPRTESTPREKLWRRAFKVK